MVMQRASRNYPAGFACPATGGYSMVVSAGLLRDEDTYPTPNQRRENAHMPTLISVAFVMPVKELFRWQSWVNKNGYAWFNIELAHPFMPAGVEKELIPVRFTDSQLGIQYGDFGTVSIGATLELSPAVFAESELS
jgi:hypothetical protein